MTDRDGGGNAAPTNASTDYVDYRDKGVMQALVTVGALVALADGHLETSPSQGVTRPPARAASQCSATHVLRR